MVPMTGDSQQADFNEMTGSANRLMVPQPGGGWADSAARVQSLPEWPPWLRTWVSSIRPESLPVVELAHVAWIDPEVLGHDPRRVCLGTPHLEIILERTEGPHKGGPYGRLPYRNRKTRFHSESLSSSPP
jgi:hypothetical protein